MAEIVVADASPVIALARIEQLALLSRIFSRAILPLSVYRETQSRPDLADAQSIRLAREGGQFEVHEQSIQLIPRLPRELGEGEAQAIGLAVQIRCGVFMDENAGRAAARALGLKTIGTLGGLEPGAQQRAGAGAEAADREIAAERVLPCCRSRRHGAESAR